LASRALSASAAPISIHAKGRKDSHCGDAQNFGRDWNIFQRGGGKYAFHEAPNRYRSMYRTVGS
jgi:hypothetical protein